ncbi:gamma-butyrobetaine hydroxylase-like domain-containing protein [Pseudoalteromonas fenneropenaei]|uniref:Gamma-butyrobetaine hydroxylase-like domain-containing protein n=1 Tax=Pseudoalteromonas fenneropenaei TaxID=1737459 RepID=A0ABV7CNE3_9GAMM
MYLVTKLHYHQRSKVLDILFDDNWQASLSCEFLRTHSPSAEVQGHQHQHGLKPSKLVLGKEQVAITQLEPVGHYAVRLIFDDGHQTGLFSWQYLRALAEQQPQLWSAYQARVTAHHETKDNIPIKFMP